jgi:hypothetical protein
VALGKYSSTAHLTWLLQKTVGDGEKQLTYLNSALKVLLGTFEFSVKVLLGIDSL